jgi:predicted nucleic acid-binding protein
VKLLLPEVESERAKELWDAAPAPVSASFVIVEAMAALAAAQRARRVSARLATRLQGRLERLGASLLLVELNADLARAAGDLAGAFALRAGDAVHLASALALGDPEVVFVSWDDDLGRAAAEAGLPVAP